jgi:hypothetical protein
LLIHGVNYPTQWTVSKWYTMEILDKNNAYRKKISTVQVLG